MRRNYCENMHDQSDGIASDSVISGSGSGLDEVLEAPDNGDDIMIGGVMELDSIGDLSPDFDANLLQNPMAADEILSEDSRDFCNDVYLKPR